MFDAVVEHGGGLVMSGRLEKLHCLLTLSQHRHVSQRTQEPQSARMGECEPGRMTERDHDLSSLEPREERVLLTIPIGKQTL